MFHDSEGGVKLVLIATVKSLARADMEHVLPANSAMMRMRGRTHAGFVEYIFHLEGVVSGYTVICFDFPVFLAYSVSLGLISFGESAV